MTTAGDAGGTGSLTGFYFREARFLSTVRLEIDGQRLWLCEAASVSPDQLQFVYTYPEVAVYEGGGSGQAGDEEPRNQKGIPQRGIDVTLTYRVGLDRLSATAVLGNRTRDPLTFELSWLLEADFADIQEAQAGRREQEAAVDIQPAGNEIRFAYQHNDLPYIGAVSSAGGAWRIGPRGATIEVALPPEAIVRLEFEARVIRAVGGEMAGVEERTAFLERWRNSFTRIRSPRNGLAESNDCRQHPRLRLVSARRGRAGRVAGAAGRHAAVSRVLRSRRGDRRVAGGLRRCGRASTRR